MFHCSSFIYKVILLDTIFTTTGCHLITNSMIGWYIKVSQMTYF